MAFVSTSSIAAVFFKYFLLISSAETFHILTNFHFPITSLVDSLHISVNGIENEIKVYIFMWAKYDQRKPVILWKNCPNIAIGKIGGGGVLWVNQLVSASFLEIKSAYRKLFIFYDTQIPL